MTLPFRFITAFENSSSEGSKWKNNKVHQEDRSIKKPQEFYRIDEESHTLFPFRKHSNFVNQIRVSSNCFKHKDVWYLFAGAFFSD